MSETSGNMAISPVNTPGDHAACDARFAALQREYDTYRRALWLLVRQLGNNVYLSATQMEEVPLLATLGVSRESRGIRIAAEEEP